MPTLFNRIYAYSATKKLPILELSHRLTLGWLVIEAYKVSGIKKRYTHVKAKPFDYDGNVVNYPIEFKEIMDKMIKEYYDNPPLITRAYEPKKIKELPQLIATQEPKKRKRIVHKSIPIFSTKKLQNG